VGGGHESTVKARAGGHEESGFLVTAFSERSLAGGPGILCGLIYKGLIPLPGQSPPDLQGHPSSHGCRWPRAQTFRLQPGGRLLAFCLGWLRLHSSYFKLPDIAGMTGTHHHTQLFLLRWGLMNFLPKLARNLDSPALGLPCSLGGQV
jgi:hypothetical protein